MDKLISMRVFREVVERGGFNRAAEHLGIAPAAVTRHVASLENHLGTPLLVRTTRRLTLTERGEIYLRRVQAILADIEDTEATVGSAAIAYSGMLRISVPVIYGLYFLPPLLLQFRKSYPSIQFDIMLTDEAVDFVSSGREVCLAFAAHVTHPHTVTRPFGAAKTVLCATPTYLKNGPALECLEDLANHNCLGLKSPLTGEDVWQLRSRENQLFNISVKPSVICDTLALVYECVLNSLGVGRLPYLLAEDAISRGQIVQVLDRYESPDVDLVLAYPGRFYLTSKARAFIEFVLANVPGTQ